MTERPAHEGMETVRSEGAAPESGSPAALGVALVLGLLGIAFITFFTHWYEVCVFEMQGRQVIVNALAPIVFFMMFLLLVLVNPVLHRVAPGIMLRRRELLLVLSMWLLTTSLTYRYLANPVLGTIGFANNTAIDKSQTKRMKLRDYLKPPLFLKEAEAKAYYDGISDGLSWVWPVRPPAPFGEGDFRDLPSLARAVKEAQDPVSAFLRDRLPADVRSKMDACLVAYEKLHGSLWQRLKELTEGPSLYTKERFRGVALTSRIEARIAAEPQGDELARVNRLLLEKVYPRYFAGREDKGPPGLAAGDLKDAAGLALALRSGRDPFSRFLREKCLGEGQAQLEAYLGASRALRQALTAQLNEMLRGGSLYDEKRFAGVAVADELKERLKGNPSGRDLVEANRSLLAAAYPREIADVPASVPWKAWARPLAYWFPFMLVVYLLISSLMQMTHRQWSKHELLTYPIADFASSVLGQEKGRSFPTIFYDKIFWCGFIFICFIYTIKQLAQWFPLMIDIPLVYNHFTLVREFPFLNKYCGREAYSLFRGMLYPFMVCLAVLLPTEISLTCWLGWVLMIVATGFYFLSTGEVIGGTETSFIQAGMYVAMLVMIVFIGRREYASILRTAVTFRRSADAALRRAATACRGFVLAFAALVGLLAYAGADLFSSVVLVASFSLVVILIARMTAELGIPWLVSFAGMARGMPLQILGPAALGPKSLAVIAVVGAVLDQETQNNVAAQETTYRKLEERPTRGLSRMGFNAALLLAAVAALGTTVFSTLWMNYSFGARKEKRNDGIAGSMNDAATEINRLKIEKNLELASAATFFGKLKLIKEEQKFWRFFLYGAAVVSVCAWLRLRFTWWPLHPLPFLLLNTWCLSRLNFSFFVGWAIKTALLKVGGGKVFTRSKAFFIGVILGQIVMAGIWIAVSSIYHIVTAAQPKAVHFFY